MITQELIEYVRQRIADGVSHENITKELLSVNWDAGDVSKVFSTLGAASSAMTPVPGVQRDIINPTVSPNSVPGATRDSFWYRPIIIILTLVILIGIVGGGAYAYYAYSKQPSTTSVLRGALERMATIRSFDFSATSTSVVTANIASLSLSTGTGGAFKIAKVLHATSTSAQHGTIILKQQGDKYPSFDITTALQSTASVATTSVTYSLGLHSILSSVAFDLQLLYGKINIDSGDSKVRMGSVFINATLAKLSKKWVRMVDFRNASSTSPFSKVFSSLSASTTPAVSKDIKELRAYANSMQYIRSARNVGVEYLNNVPTYHLELTIQNTPKSILLMQRFVYDYIESVRASSSVTTDDITFAKFLRDTNGLNETLTQRIPINVWIGKKDSYVYKLTIPDITFVKTDKTQESRVTMREGFSFTNYNATKPIVSPKNVESLKSFISEVFSFGGGL